MIRMGRTGNENGGRCEVGRYVALRRAVKWVGADSAAMRSDYKT